MFVRGIAILQGTHIGLETQVAGRGAIIVNIVVITASGLCWLLGSSARICKVKEDYDAILLLLHNFPGAA